MTIAKALGMAVTYQVDAEMEHSNAPAVAIQVSDAMAIAFHNALSDGPIDMDEMGDIKTGLNAALANVQAPAPAVPQDMRLVPVWLLERVERSLGAFTSDEGWAQTDMDTMDSVSAMLAATPAPAQGEPFGHFRAEPFGWTDCAKDDEGAIALYERPQEVGLTDEALDNLIEDLSEWSRHVVEDTAHQTLEAHVREVLAKNPIIAALRAKGGKHV